MKNNLKWIIIFTAFCALCMAVWFLRINKNEGTVAQIKQGDKVIKTIDLSNLKEPYEEKIDDGHGGYNIIRAGNGKIAVIEANCPDKICVNQGYIDNSAVPIVCLPHKLSVTIINGENNVDAVAGVR